MKYTYIAVDIEADGPIPGDYSMLSIGAVAFNPKTGILSQFERNLKPLDGAKQHRDTMTWWKQFPKQFEKLKVNALNPFLAITDFSNWLAEVKIGELVFVSDYVGFDLQFVRWYMRHFIDEDPFWLRQLDLMSYASALTKKPQPEHTSRRVPKHWLIESTHEHSSLNDALSHANMAIHMLRENDYTE
jgi:hypothetical protein